MSLRFRVLMEPAVVALVVVFFAATNVIVAGSVLKKAGGLELLILHNNDMHARFEQTSKLSGVCSPDERDAGKCYGGFPRVAHVVKEARAAAKRGTGPEVLYLNAGDTYTGSPWFTIYKWKVAVDCLNALHPDAVSLGNHEFDERVSGLTPFIENLSSPVLAANLVLTKVPELAAQDNLHKSIVFIINGVKVGIIGYLTPDTKYISKNIKVEFTDEVSSIREEVAKLKHEGVDILIALGHSGWSKDLEIAHEVDGIDLVIGGHTNTFLWNGTAPDAEKIQGPYPTMVRQTSGRMVPAVQAYAYTKYLGRLHIVFDAEGEIISYDGSPILLDNSIPQDPDVLKIIERYRADVSNVTNEVVGNTSVLLDGMCRLHECNMGNLIADSVIFRYANDYSGPLWTDAAISIVQSGGIRTSISKLTKPGNITYGDLMMVLPFVNKIVMMTIKGSILLQALEHSVAAYSLVDIPGDFLQYSGIIVTYDLANPPGKRVVRTLVRCTACDIPVFEEIDLSREYNVLMNDFMSQGGNGYTMFEGGPIVEFDYDALEAIEFYMRRRSPVNPQVEGRITLLNGDKLALKEPTFLRQRTDSAASTKRPSLTVLALFTAIIVSKYFYNIIV